jgi:hypothetical protein
MYRSFVPMTTMLVFELSSGYPRWCMSRRWNSGNDAPISTTLIAASTAA